MRQHRTRSSGLLLVLVIVLIFFFGFEDHLALLFALVHVGLGDFLVHQVLVAVNAGCALGFHLLVRSLGIGSRGLGILVTLAAGVAVPLLQVHARIVRHDQPALVEFLQRGIVF